MKKIVILFFVLFFISLPTAVFASVGNANSIQSYTLAETVGTLFQWLIFIMTPILVLHVVVSGIMHLFKKSGVVTGTASSPKTNNIAKLIIPYTVFVGMFVFSKHQTGGYACADCFANSYEKIVVDIVAGIFLVASVMAFHVFKNKNKEWKYVHSSLAIILFLVVFYTIMAIGSGYFWHFDKNSNSRKGVISDREESYERGTIMVVFNDSVDNKEGVEIIESFGLKLSNRNHDNDRRAYFKTNSEPIETVLEKLMKEPGVVECMKDVNFPNGGMCYFKNESTKNEIKKVLDSHNLSYNERDFLFSNIFVVEVDPGTEKKWIEKMKNNPKIRFVELIHFGYAT